MKKKIYIFHQLLFYAIKHVNLPDKSFFLQFFLKKNLILLNLFFRKVLKKKKFIEITFFLGENFFFKKKKRNHLKHKNIVSFIDYPKKNFYFDHKYFREIFIVSEKKSGNCKKKISIYFLPFLIKCFFENIKNLNYIQYIVFPKIYGTDLNVLIVSPTGSGKTFLAGLGILRVCQNSLLKREHKFVINKSNFRIIFIAPLKTLVKELIKNFKNFFNDLFLEIKEMTGDEIIQKKKIFNSNIIIGTPQKIYYFFKESINEKFMKSVRLLVIDEIHLLNEKRGAILEEFLVWFLSSKKSKKFCRIIGMSATLPNFLDVARFLNVNFLKGLFFFGNSFKEVCSKKTLIGIKNLIFEKNILNILNAITKSKVEFIKKKKKKFQYNYFCSK